MDQYILQIYEVRVLMLFRKHLEFRQLLEEDFGWTCSFVPTTERRKVRIKLFTLKKNRWESIRRRQFLGKQTIIGISRRQVFRENFWVSFRRKNENLEIAIGLRNNPAEQYADIFKVLLAALGEEWEALGYVRLHAAIFEQEAGVCLFEGPPHSGKSWAALDAAQRQRRVWTDEFVLIKKGQFYSLSFPFSLKKGELILEKINFIKKEKALNPQKLKILIPNIQIGMVSVDRILVPETFFKRSGFFLRTIIGYGNIQMIEYRLRLDSLSGLVQTFVKRILVGIYLCLTYDFSSSRREKP